MLHVPIKPIHRLFEDAGETLESDPPTAHRALKALRAPNAQSAQAQISSPELDPAALHGLAGRLVRAIAPHTEAHEAALLVNLLAGFGSLAGRDCFTMAGNSPHHPNLFALLVGLTSKGRKGTSWSCVRPVLEALDPEWAQRRVVNGLVSGEGLIHAVRDPETAGEGENARLDPGESDKRLLVLEEEFSGPMKAMKRDTNTLSPVLRSAWDGANLRTLAKTCPNVATAPHIAIVGHITRQEALSLMRQVEGYNGFANRFLWVYTERSKILPEGGRVCLDLLAPLLGQLRRHLELARQPGERFRTPAARLLWAELYPALSEGQPGLIGAVTSRAEAQVLRLALVYSLIDGSEAIDRDHLQAAHALWRYCQGTAEWVFGTVCNHPVADKIWDTLRHCPEGLSRKEIRERVFQRKRHRDHLLSGGS